MWVGGGRNKEEAMFLLSARGFYDKPKNGKTPNPLVAPRTGIRMGGKNAHKCR